MAELETRVTTLEQQVSNVMTKLDMFIEESRAERKKLEADMREAREKHDADIKEIRENMREDRKKHDEDIRAARDKHDEDMREMRQTINSMGEHVRNMSIVTIIGIAAMVVAVFLK